MAGYSVKQSSTAYPLVFLMIDSSDHVSGKASLSPTVTISKAGGSFGSPAGAVTEIASGWYKVAGNATDTATLGPLILHATGSGADPCDILYEVVAYDPQVAWITAGTGSGQLNVASGVADANLVKVNGAAATGVTDFTVADVAAAILTTPANLLATDTSGRVSLNVTQAVPVSNTANTVGDCLNAARAESLGAWDYSSHGSGVVKNSDGSTLKTFTITYDANGNPITRS